MLSTIFRVPLVSATAFTLGASPTYNLQLANQYKITGITAPISKGTDNHLKFDYDTDFFQIVNTYFKIVQRNTKA